MMHFSHMLKIELMQGTVCARQTEANARHLQRSRSLYKTRHCCDLTQILFTALLFTAVADQGAFGYIQQDTSTSRIRIKRGDKGGKKAWWSGIGVFFKSQSLEINVLFSFSYFHSLPAALSTFLLLALPPVSIFHNLASTCYHLPPDFFPLFNLLFPSRSLPPSFPADV